MAIRARIQRQISNFVLVWLGFICVPVVAGADELLEVGHPDVDFLYATMGAVDDYENVVLEPVSVWYPNDIADASAAADELRRDAIGEFADAAAAHGLDMHTALTGDALIARIQYIDLTAATDEMPEWAEQFQFRVEPGFVTLVAELRDAESGRVLVRMANLQDPQVDRNDLATLLDAALTANVDEVVASN